LLRGQFCCHCSGWHPESRARDPISWGSSDGQVNSLSAIGRAFRPVLCVMRRLLGRSSRPGLPCLRAAVGPYLFHMPLIESLSAFFPRSENAEILLYPRVVQPDFLRRIDQGDLSAIQNRDVIGDVENKGWVLLNQQDR